MSALTSEGTLLCNNLPAVERKVGVSDWIIASILVIYCNSIWYWPLDSQVAVQLVRPFDAISNYMIFFAALLCVFRVNVQSYISKQGYILLFFSIFAMASSFWALNFISTLRSSASFVSVVLICIVQSDKLGSIKHFKTIYVISIIVLFLSALGSFVGLDSFIMAGAHEGLWRGLFNHKNLLGAFSAQLLIITFFCAGYLGFSRAVRSSLYVLGFVVLFMSGSSTALAALLFGIVITISASLLKRVVVYNFFLFFILIFLLIVTFNYYQVVLDYTANELGRDTSFTGRDRIWTFFLYIIKQSPGLGWGYGSPYLPDDFFASAQQNLFASVRSPHNTYLALALNLGWIGAYMYAGWLIEQVRYGLIWLNRSSFAKLYLALGLASIQFSMFEVVGWAAITRGDFFYLFCVYLLIWDENASKARSKQNLGR